jgi:hypothetical protein
MRHTLTVVAALDVVCSACGDTGGKAAQISVRDSAGIEIVESTPGSRETAKPLVIDTVPLFDIGADPSDPNQEFSSPSNPMRLADGRIAVAEPGAQEIRFFDSRGVWRRSVGRKGQGPGEFSDLRQLFLGPSDSLYAYEPGTGFVSVFDSEARYARRIRLQPAGEGRFAILSGVFANGRWLVDGSKSGWPSGAGAFESEHSHELRSSHRM